MIALIKALRDVGVHVCLLFPLSCPLLDGSNISYVEYSYDLLFGLLYLLCTSICYFLFPNINDWDGGILFTNGIPFIYTVFVFKVTIG